MFLLFQVRHFTIKPINVKKKRKKSIGVLHVTMYIYFDHESMTLTMELLLGSSDGVLAVKHN